MPFFVSAVCGTFFVNYIVDFLTMLIPAVYIVYVYK